MPHYGNATATPSPPPPEGRLPVDLMRRIPVNPDAYHRWQTTWTALRNGHTKQELAHHLGVSVRHLDFVAAAGTAGLLDHPTPPAHRLADLAAINNTSSGGHAEPPTHEP